MELTLFNTLTNKEEIIKPIKAGEIALYACGPTVYDTPHIGNARSNVFYDLLFRILRGMYDKVTYARNITDVDDKILERAKRDGITPEELTTKTTKEFHDILENLNCLKPTFEPKATEFIPQMVKMIKTLIEKGFAYKSGDDVLFSVLKYKDYGQLSNKKLDDLIAGARVNVTENKQHAGDFVLWKNVPKNEYGFETSLGYGRPGWHIECSAMSTELLGHNFDIHGGGIDLQFPHHENEIAQACACYNGSSFAKYWVHNGFLKVNGEKMSKSLGNFLTVNDILKNHSPMALRLCLLSTHYRKPLDYNENAIKAASTNLAKFQKCLDENAELFEKKQDIKLAEIPTLAREALLANVNISKYLAIMHAMPKDIKNTNDPKGKKQLVQEFWNMGALIGVFG